MNLPSLPQADSRLKALDILIALEQRRVTLDVLMDELFAHGDEAAHRETALVQNLVYGVLRWRLRLDWVISQLSKTPMHKIDPPVKQILRLGLYQILFLDRIPHSAAVNIAVEMTKSYAAPWVVRFVNGVLRSAARHPARFQKSVPPDDGTAETAVWASLPEWLIKRWVSRFGPQDTRRLCDTINQIPDIDIRINPLKTDRETLLENLSPDVTRAAPCRYSPWGIRVRGGRRLFTLPAFEDGWFSVQDEAAQMTGFLLDPQPGDTVLDACAGQGGKTGHLAHLMKKRGRIMAMDADAARLDRLATDMRRLSVDNVDVQRHDLRTALPATWHGRFDRVLVDAPCSGLGVIRRNPDTRWGRTASDLPRFSKHQLALLDNVAKLVKSGGILLYAVCSFEPEENEQVVSAFLDRHRSFRPAPAHGRRLLPTLADLIDRDGLFRTYPHIHGTDGFFAAVFKRDP